MFWQNPNILDTMDSLGSCPLAITRTTDKVEKESSPRGEQIGEETMETKINVSTNNELETQRKYLLNRLWDVRLTKKNTARKDFRMDDDPTPHSWTELQERIASGKFIWDKEGEEKAVKEQSIWNPFTFITWRDPAAPADEAGYEAFRQKLETAYLATQDDIKIKSPEAGLESLRTFEAATL